MPQHDTPDALTLASISHGEAFVNDLQDTPTSGAGSLDNDQQTEGDRLPDTPLEIPNVHDCLPKAAKSIGGRNFYHPGARLLVKTTPEIIEAEHFGRGTIKTVIPASAVTFHNKSQLTWSAYSAKMGQVFTGTGPHEMGYMMEQEADADVYAYTMRWVRYIWDAGKIFTPDIASATVKSKLVLSEVKASRSYFWPVEYRHTIFNAKRTADALGVEFRQLTGEDLYNRRQRYLNLSRIYDDRLAHFSAEDQDVVENELAKRPDTSLGKIQELISPHPRQARAKAHAMLCRRLIAFSFDAAITEDTLVRKPTEVSNPIDLSQLFLTEPGD
jgi:hypothetical protein